MAQLQNDVLIIGGGLAGIVACLELLTAGRSVTLLDRDEAQHFGGLAKESFGGVFVVDSQEQRRHGLHDSTELAYQDWLSFGEFKAEDEWPRRWAQTYVHECNERVYCWLKSQGIRFLPLPNWVERGQYQPGNSLPRFHMIWGTGQELIRQLLLRLENHPRHSALTLKFGYRVESLILESGAIRGCRGVTETEGTPFEAHGEMTIVATGGINGCLEQVRRHWHSDWNKPPAVLLNGSHRYADGLLHQAVAETGGVVTHLDKMWNYAAGVHHWRPRKPAHGLSLVPPRSALWLNWRGERMGPEPLVSGFDTRELVRRVCQEEQAHSWLLLNHRIALRELAVSGAEFNPSIRNRQLMRFLLDLILGNRQVVADLLEHCEDFVVAQSLPELVEKMNRLQGTPSVDLKTVQEAVGRYDAQIERGPKLHNDEQLRRIAALRQWRGDRLRTCRFQKINHPAALPLIAIRTFIISRKSLGGIQTDLDSKVLDSTGQPIPGLYAIGEAAGFGGGGMNGLRALEGTFLGGCILTARRAARSILR